MNQRAESMEHVSTDKLMEDLKTVVQDAEELLKATAGQAGEKVAAVRAKAEASLKAAKERLSHVQDGVVAQARYAAQCTDKYVRDNPWQSVGMGAAVGLLIGLLVSRR